MKKTFLTILAVAAATTAYSKIWMPAIFDSGMVLQRETNVRLWGTTDTKKTIKVNTSWNDKTYLCKPDSDGRWNVSVSTPAAGGP